MTITSRLSSRRIRVAAAVAAVISLIALGGVTAASAAADVSVTIVVNDNSNGAKWANRPLFLHSVSGTSTAFTTDRNGAFAPGPLPEGDYYVALNDSRYVPSAVFTLDATTTVQQVYVDRYKVEGSIPAGAASGETTVDFEVLVGPWTWVGSASVTSASGDFSFHLPAGPAEYRLHFLPSAATDYRDTYSSTFTVDGSLAVVNIGAVELNLAPTIRGTVLADDGVTPIVGATVRVAAGGTEVATGVTNSAGAYSIRPGVGDADYTVTAEAANYLDQEWDATAAGTETVPFNATDGYVHTGIDFTLQKELVTVTGSVLNWTIFAPEITAELWAGGSGSPTKLADSDVARGRFSFPNVWTGGQYFIKIVPGGNNAFLPTNLGSAGYTEWSKDSDVDAAFSTDHSFTVDAGSLVHNVTVEQGSLLRGYFTSFGQRIDGCVYLTEVSDPASTICAQGNSSGYWTVRLPVGGTYSLHAVDTLGAYAEQWWEGSSTEARATPVGPVTGGYFGEFNFSPQQSPAKLYGYVSDANAGADPITVHLYVKRSGEWYEANEKVVTAGEVLFWENINNDPVIGLVRGDYRMRFADSSGKWLAATSYSTGLLPDAGTPGTAPACLIDFDDVQMGRASFIQASFDSSQVSDCGPQPLNFGNMSGHVESSADFGNVDVALHEVVFFGGQYPYGATTASDGTFTITNVPNGTYSLEVMPRSHLSGNHEYRYTESAVVLTGGNVSLGDLVATRYGNVSGQISNWDDATMAGAVATVYHQVTDAGGTHWTAGPLDVAISSTGEFEVPGIDVDGEYAVLVTFDNTYAPVFVGGGFPTPSSAFTGTAEQDYALGSVTVSTDELVTISGDVSFGGTPIARGGVVVAHPVGLDGADFYGIVDFDGHYTVEVAPNVEYAIAAIDQSYGFGTGQLLMQLYGGYNYPVDVLCPCEIDLSGPYAFNAVAVASSDVSGIDFSLVATNDVLVGADVYSWDAATDDYQWFDNVDVHLYKYIAGSWVEVDTMNTYADPWRELVASGDGDYRVRFSTNGVWLAIHSVDSKISYPYAARRVADTTMVPARCYYEFSDVVHGSYIDARIGLIEDVACVETVVTPAPTPIVTGTKKPLAQTSDATVTEDVTPTATPTPSPEPSESATDGSGDDGVVDKPATASVPDFAWVFWLLGVLVLLLLAGGAIYFVRRRY